MQDWNTVRPRGSGLQLRSILLVAAVLAAAAIGAQCFVWAVFG